MTIAQARKRIVKSRIFGPTTVPFKLNDRLNVQPKTSPPFRYDELNDKVQCEELNEDRYAPY